MSLCLACVSRLLDCVPACLAAAAVALQAVLPAHVAPVGGSVLLQLLLTVLYEELQDYARVAAADEKSKMASQNGEACGHAKPSKSRGKHVRIAGPLESSSSSSMDGSASCVALAAAEALCCVDEGDKHTQQLRQLLLQAGKPFVFSDRFGLEDFPEFSNFMEQGNAPGINVERAGDASALTGQLLMSAAGRDSLRVVYEHLMLHEEWIYKELGVEEQTDGHGPAVAVSKAPLLYTMFHIGRQPFDQYLRGEWKVAWGGAVARARSLAGAESARAHVTRRADMRSRAPSQPSRAADALADLHRLFSAPPDNVL